MRCCPRSSRRSVKPEDTYKLASQPRDELAVVHVNVDGRVKRRRRRAGIKSNSSNLRRRAIPELDLGPGVNGRNWQDLRYSTGDAAITEHDKDFLADLGIDQPFVGLRNCVSFANYTSPA